MSYSVPLLKTTFNHWLEDKAPQLGAALAYYTVFSLAPIVLVFFAEETRLDFEDAFEIEGVLSQYPGEIDATSLRSVNRGIGVDVSDAAFDRCEAARIDKIDLVDEHDVGKGELFLRFRRPG